MNTRAKLLFIQELHMYYYFHQYDEKYEYVFRECDIDENNVITFFD